MNTENLDNYINWLIDQRKSKAKLKMSRKEFKKLTPEELEKPKPPRLYYINALASLSRRGYFSPITMERIKKLPLADLIDIYHELLKRMSPKERLKHAVRDTIKAVTAPYFILLITVMGLLWLLAIILGLI